MELNSYIAILAPPKHKKPPPSSGAIQLFFLASLLQCTSINRCALQLRAKKYFFLIKFLSPLLFKKYFLFLSFSLSGFSFFFLFPSHFFFSPSFTLCFADLFWIHLHRRSSSSSPSHVTVPRRRPISPNPPSHCRSKLHCRPKFHRRSKLHQHRLHRTQERHRFCGWISWLWLDFVVAVWLDFMVAVDGCSWLAMVVDWFVVFLLQ